jgi:hypothetical protein
LSNIFKANKRCWLFSRFRKSEKNIPCEICFARASQAFSSFQSDYDQARATYFASIQNQASPSMATTNAFTLYTTQRVSLLAQQLINILIQSPEGTAKAPGQPYALKSRRPRNQWRGAFELLELRGLLSLVLTPLDVTATQQIPFDTVVAKLVDTNLNASPSDFNTPPGSVQINWGDGSTGSGLVVGPVLCGQHRDRQYRQLVNNGGQHGRGRYSDFHGHWNQLLGDTRRGTTRQHDRRELHRYQP